MDVEVDPQNVEACHWLKSNNSSKKAIIKLSKRKDAAKICELKKKLKSLKFEWMSINNPIFINDSLCGYYRELWTKCKMIWINKYIQGFWVLYRSIKVKVSESSTPCVITHDVDLESMFPEDPLLKDISRIE